MVVGDPTREYVVFELRMVDETTEVDFNQASSPWRACDAKYTCPVPPARNWLDVPVEAGEKAFQMAHADSA